MKRGSKPKGKIKIKWSPDFAYAIGLLVTDGCVVSDGLHISFVSKDLEQVENFNKCFGISGKIGENIAGHKKSYTHRVQFGDVNFVKFLSSIGIGPAKSKTISKIDVPPQYFFDYLRGCFDGDGSIYSYWDPRWKSSFMFYLSFASASQVHVDWLRSEMFQRLGIMGHVTKAKNESTIQLKYAKTDSLKIIEKIYYSDDVICLSRKRLKILEILAIVNGLKPLHQA